MITKHCVFALIATVQAQTGCSEQCPDIGDDFSCGKLLKNYTEESSVSFPFQKFPQNFQRNLNIFSQTHGSNVAI